VRNEPTTSDCANSGAAATHNTITAAVTLSNKPSARAHCRPVGCFALPVLSVLDRCRIVFSTARLRAIAASESGREAHCPPACPACLWVHLRRCRPCRRHAAGHEPPQGGAQGYVRTPPAPLDTSLAKEGNRPVRRTVGRSLDKERHGFTRRRGGGAIPHAHHPPALSWVLRWSCSRAFRASGASEF
jgi:predicted RNA-binding Zn-ribbon protein involved in translation (DUF1610 family)